MRGNVPLKNLRPYCCILAYPKTDRPYKLYTDASDYAVGVILVQEDEEGVERVIHYLSHTLDSVKRKWATLLSTLYKSLGAAYEGQSLRSSQTINPLSHFFNQKLPIQYYRDGLYR